MKYGVTTVGATATVLNALVQNIRNNVLILAPGPLHPNSNSEPVYVGDGNVTTGTGFPLLPGDALELGVDRIDEVYLISTNGSQTVYWITL